MLKNLIIIQGPAASGKTSLANFMVRNVHPQRLKHTSSPFVNFGKPLEAVVLEGLDKGDCEIILRIAKQHIMTTFIVTSQYEFNLDSVLTIKLK